MNSLSGLRRNPRGLSESMKDGPKLSGSHGVERSCREQKVLSQAWSTAIIKITDIPRSRIADRFGNFDRDFPDRAPRDRPAAFSRGNVKF